MKAQLLGALLAFLILSVFLIIPVVTRANMDNSLLLLAQQFSKGHISIEPVQGMPLGDLAFSGDRFYIYFGPFASIALVPFVTVFGSGFPQAMLGVFSMVASFYAVYSIARYFKFSSIDASWIAVFVTFSTVLFSLSVINISAYQVQALGMTLVLLSLREYFRDKKRPLLIGVFLGLALLTRMILVVGILFFILEFWQKRLNRQEIIRILLPFAFSLLLLGAYNFIRFDSPLDSGYAYSTALNTYPISENYAKGYMSPVHIPANLYAFFIKPPEVITESEHGYILQFPYFKADPWGLAIWFTSPLFLALLYKFRKGKYTKSALITAFLLFLPVVTYFSVGFAQFGYRYAADFLPFLLVALLPCLSPRLTRGDIALIFIGVVLNCIYMTSLWGVYPHFGIN